MSESEALAILHRILTAALEQPCKGVHIRELAQEVGDLRGAMRSALCVIEQAGGGK